MLKQDQAVAKKINTPFLYHIFNIQAVKSLPSMSLLGGVERMNH